MRTSTVIGEGISVVGKTNSLFKKAKNELSSIRKAILKELNRCKETGKLVAITSAALDEGTVLGSVEDIYRNESDEVVVVKWYNANNIASRTHIFMEEILSVNPINKLKKNPLTMIR